MRPSIDFNVVTANQELKSFEQVLLDIICKPPIFVPIASYMLGIIFVLMASDSFSLPGLIIWLIFYIAVSTARFITLRFWMPSRNDISDSTKLDIGMYMSLAIGLFTASSVIFFFSYSELEKGIQSIVIMGTSIGTTISVAGYRRHLLAYAAPPTISLGIAWATYPFSDGLTGASILVGFLAVVYLAVITRFSDLFHGFFLDSYNNQLAQYKLNQQLSEALLDSEAANQSKSLFFASANHDLRQPIHTLSLLTAALSMRQIDEEGEKILGHIDTAMGNLSAQMDSMLDIARLDAGVYKAEMSSICIDQLLEKMLNEYLPLADQKGLDLRFSNNDRSTYTKSDPELLERVIRNLLENAIKYTETGGIEIALEIDSEYFYIEIRDTGIGIGPDEQRRIFDEFYQIANPSRDRSHGMGLGLSIVKRITDLLGIALDFESKPGEGSTFTISMPHVPADALRKEQQTQNNTTEIDTNKTILCIDDEVDVLNAMAILLRDLGFAVITASNAEQALALSETGSPDIILADFRLSGTENGIDVIESIRKRTPNIPAILVSGDIGKDRLQQAEAAKIPLLSKPLRFELLKKALTDILSEAEKLK